MSKCEIIYGEEHIPIKYTFGDIVYYVYKKRKNGSLESLKLIVFYSLI